jgi:putative phosphoribosyl transferase
MSIELIRKRVDMHFKDRNDAGKQLAQHLKQYKNKPNVMVIGLPRGGVVIAFEIAKALQLPLDLVVPRKIGSPYNQELAVGALTEDGTVIFNDELMESLNLKPKDVQSIITVEKKEAVRRLQKYRAGRKPLNLKDKIVILVDDGIATGATMRAAIASVRARGAKKIIVVTPVAPAELIDELRREVDDVVYLVAPSSFLGISAFYDFFPQTQDETVIELLHAETQAK